MSKSDPSDALLLPSWESLHSLVEMAPFGVYVVDSDFRIAQINASAQERAFRNVVPALGRDFAEAMHVLWPDDVAENVIAEFRRTLELGEPYHSHDYVHARADIDSVEAYEWELHRITLPDGRFGVACYYFDSTRLRESEQALRRNEAWLRCQKEAFQASVDGSPLVTSLEILVRFAVEHAGGDTRAAFLLVDPGGRAIRHVVGMGEDYERVLGDFPIGADSIGCGLAAHTGKPVVYTDVRLAPEWVPHLQMADAFGFRACWSLPVQSTGGTIVGTFCTYFREPREAVPRDFEVASAIADSAALIISRHRATEERTKAERALREADRRKDEFLAMLAHELRNPLAAIQNAGRILLRDEGDAQARRSAAEILNRQVELMVRQVDDLLDVSRVSRDAIELRKEHVALDEVVRRALDANRSSFEGAGPSLSVALPETPIHVDGDPIRLAQVVGNLLHNACKFTDPGGRIELSVATEGESAVIRVKDSGIGIAADELPRIFELFVQIDTSLERTRNGLGLGLTLVKRLVEMHGGSVEASSAGIGRGSEFVVRLPSIATPVPREPSAPPISELRATPRRVLVVDDNEDSAATLSMLMEMLGYEVDTAYDGLGAVERAASFEADIVLLDIGLPGLNGYEAARRIREQSRRPPSNAQMLVALTGWGQDEDRRRSKEAGFDAHLVKPVDLGLLTKLIADFRGG